MTSLAPPAKFTGPDAVPVAAPGAAFWHAPVMLWVVTGAIFAFLITDIAIGYKSREISTAVMVQLAESANVTIAQILANDLRDEDPEHYERSNLPRLIRTLAKSDSRAPVSSDYLKLDRIIKGRMRGTFVRKIKIYSHSGTTIYSTDVSQLGEDYSAQPGVIAGLADEKYSQLVVRPSFSGIEGMLTNQRLVQSYVPVRMLAGEKGLWVFEVYTDVASELGEMDAAHKFLETWVNSLMGVLFFALLALGLRGRKQLRDEARERIEEMQRLVAKEHQIEREKQEFLATAAHELRTPMTGVLGYAELLEQRNYSADRSREIGGIIATQSRDMTRLLDDLLELSALEQRSEMVVRPAFCDLGTCIEAALARLNAASLNRQVKVSVEPGLPQLWLDSGRIVQLVVNVLNNACKYSPDGSEVVLEALHDPLPGATRVGVRISDQGCGMTAQEVSHLFDRFWRSERASPVKGTGLGMAIVKLIVDKHEGAIDVDSRPGTGTRITIWFKTGQATGIARH